VVAKRYRLTLTRSLPVSELFSGHTVHSGTRHD